MSWLAWPAQASTTYPAAPVVLAPARGHGGFGAVVGLAVLVVHEAVAAAPLRRPGPGVVLHRETVGRERAGVRSLGYLEGSSLGASVCLDTRRDLPELIVAVRNGTTRSNHRRPVPVLNPKRAIFAAGSIEGQSRSPMKTYPRV